MNLGQDGIIWGFANWVENLYARSYMRRLGIVVIILALVGVAGYLLGRGGSASAPTPSVSSRKPPAATLAQVRRALARERALLAPSVSAIFSGSSCATSKTAANVEVFIYAAAPAVASCSKWIQSASGSGALWVPGTGAYDGTDTEICALVSGANGVAVLDTRDGFFGTEICSQLVHNGWTEVQELAG